MLLFLWRWLSFCLYFRLCLCNSWCQPPGRQRSKVRVSLDRQSDTNPQRTFSHRSVCSTEAQRAECTTAAVTPANRHFYSSNCCQSRHRRDKCNSGGLTVEESLFSEITWCKRSSSLRLSEAGRAAGRPPSLIFSCRSRRTNNISCFMAPLDYKFRSKPA